MKPQWIELQDNVLLVEAPTISFYETSYTGKIIFSKNCDNFKAGDTVIYKERNYKIRNIWGIECILLQAIDVLAKVYDTKNEWDKERTIKYKELLSNIS